VNQWLIGYTKVNYETSVPNAASLNRHLLRQPSYVLVTRCKKFCASPQLREGILDSHCNVTAGTLTRHVLFVQAAVTCCAATAAPLGILDLLACSTRLCQSQKNCLWWTERQQKPCGLRVCSVAGSARCSWSWHSAATT
jgi:hypothetical protein